MREKIFTLAVCFILLLSRVYAQKTVTGTVFDDGQLGVPGASVIQKGTTLGTITDVDGKFSISVPDDAVLVISFMGMITQELSVQGKTSLNVVLKEDVGLLDGVVVVGYGTQKKVNLTGAVAQVKMDEVLGDRPVTSVASALQGAIPGLQITGGASPGDALNINIRGITSIASQGNTPTSTGEPLVLIDNVPGDISLLNPEDIESVSVLKDAASAAIYGARGAFGVILISTKKSSRQNKLALNYSNNFAFQSSINRPEQASLEQYLMTMKDFLIAPVVWNNNVDEWLGYVIEYNQDPSAFMANHSNDYFQDGRYMPQGGNYYFYLEGVDPQKAILDNYGFQQTHNVSASGNSGPISYRMSMGYVDQDGPLITSKDSYDRINTSSYVNADITPWLSQSIDAFFTRAKRSYVENGRVFGTSDPCFTPQGYMPASDDLEGDVYPVLTPKNVLLHADPSRWLTENTRLFSRTVINPFKGLEAVFEYTYRSTNKDYKRFTNNVNMINISNDIDGLSGTPKYNNNKTSTVLSSINAYATYEFNLQKDHALKVMSGYSQETRDYEILKVDKTEIVNQDKPSFSGATGITNATDAYLQYAIRSGFFRFNYDYKGRYLLEVNGRYDGSSKFPKGTRFGFFPSVSAGWRIDSEPFVDLQWLDLAKLRASYGELGNQAGVAEYGYLALMKSKLGSWIVNGELPVILLPSELVRADYTWELVRTLDLGYDIAVLNNRLSSTFDWYERNTIGMLAPGVQLPSVIGADAPDQNAADLQTSGWEFSLQWKDRIGDDWRYGLGFNLYDSKTVITEYDNEAGLFYNSAENNNYREGMEIGEIWGYVSDGFYTADDFSDLNNFTLKEGVAKLDGYTAKPGDVKFVDFDGDGKISVGENTVCKPGDRKIIGNSSPRYQYGINANIGWKALDLSVLLQGVGQRDVWVNNDLVFGPTVFYVGVYSDVLDYWKPVDHANANFTAVNPDAYLPRIYGENENSGSNYRTQTKYLQNASYLRLKNITLSYNFPTQLMQKIGFVSGKVFFSGENLLTIDHLNKGIDPERISWGYPFYTTYSFGINLTL
ncbi:MAG: SusC/RagA family TonB-linked outer membrane protein [Bacteroidales bacterium]